MHKKKTIIVNLFAGPGAGKSTTAFGVAHKLKLAGVDAELVTEYAKDVTWQENFNTLSNQIYVFAKQHNRQFHLRGKVDVIVTDSPIVLSLAYCDCENISDAFPKLVIDEFNHEDTRTVNYFINRVKPYNPNGRSQDEEEAKVIDGNVRDMLTEYEIDYHQINGDENAVDFITNEVLKILE